MIDKEEKKSVEDREALFEALHILYARLETLRNMDGPEMLLPGRIETYRNILENAYVAYAKIETSVEELGQE